MDSRPKGSAISQLRLADRFIADGGDPPAGQAVDDEKALPALWSSLRAGSSRVVEVFATDVRFGMIVAHRIGVTTPAVEPADLPVLERMLTCTRQKEIGFEVGVSPASTSRILARALTQIGLGCLPSRLPLLLVVAEYAARAGGGTKCVARVGSQRADDTVYQSITLHRATAWLANRLSPAQCRVAGLIIDAKTHTEIAARCNISPRTVANHLASAYQKLGVSGRLELLSTLAVEYVRGNVPSG